MATLGYVEIVQLVAVVLSFFYVIWQWRRPRRNSKLITNWPVVGMMPDLLKNINGTHDYAAEVLREFGGTLEVKGPAAYCLANLDFVLTSNPANVKHILNTNFANYTKGPDFKTMFEPLGDGIFSSDFDSWKLQKKIFQSLIAHNKHYDLFMHKTIQQKVVHGLIPVLDHVSKSAVQVELQDVFQRLTFDNICLLVLGIDPVTLSVEFPNVEYQKAFDVLEEIVLQRHVLPASFWKVQRWLQIGGERKFRKAWKVFDDFLYQIISSKRQHFKSRCKNQQGDEIANFDMLTAYLEEEKKQGEVGLFRNSDKFLRDTAFNLIGAGRDTVGACLTWFFWLVGTNPIVETKILEEMKKILPIRNDQNCGVFSAQELNKLVFLHAALCETLRLYPPVPVNHKTSVEADTLPSGHRLKPNNRVLLSFYSMGRMEEIWGKDCLEFKPERWISSNKGGGIVYVPPYKFTAFNAGPRTCLGKDMSFIQLKIIATAILWNYRVQVVEKHPITPSNSIVLHMKHGLMVKVYKRSI